MADQADAGFRLDHTGLAVADLTAARRWFCDVFGLKPELTLRVEALDLDIETLIHPEYGYRLELLHRPGSAAGKPAAYGRAVARGARPVVPPGPAPEPGARMAFIADREGNLIEFLHRRPQAG
jgi:catechol 2,3-dioxygenase-like lactoylglutathione lyase family enzyme